MSFVPAWNVKRYSATPVFGSSVNGGSLWGRIKSIARRIFSSPGVKKIASSVAQQVFKAAPGLIDQGVQALDKSIGPKLPGFLRGKRTDIFHGIKKLGDIGTKALKDQVEKQLDKPIETPDVTPEGKGVKVARIPKKFTARKASLIARLMK